MAMLKVTDLRVNYGVIPALKGIYPVILPVVAVCAIAYSRLLYKKGKI